MAGRFYASDARPSVQRAFSGLLRRLRNRWLRMDTLSALRRGLRRRVRRSPAQMQRARRLRELREELSATIGDVDACRNCAIEGPWAGGHCCGGVTDRLFTAPELAALRLGGTRPRHLATPNCEQRGCVFRGPQGCSLATGDRPNICVAYLCGDLGRELSQNGRLPRVLELQRELETTMAQFRETLEGAPNLPFGGTVQPIQVSAAKPPAQ